MKNNCLIKLANSAILFLQKYSKNQTLQRQFQAYGLLQHLKALQLSDIAPLIDTHHQSGVGFRNLLEKKGLRITLYFLRKGEVIKLHNHPCMLVVSFVLTGSLEVKSYSPTNIPCVFDKETSVLNVHSLSFIDGIRSNYKNLHELKALQNTYFIDILFPDYCEKRECNFFEEEQEIDGSNVKLRTIVPSELAFFQI